MSPILIFLYFQGPPLWEFKNVLEEGMDRIGDISESNNILTEHDRNFLKIVQEMAFVKLFAVCLHSNIFTESVSCVRRGTYSRTHTRIQPHDYTHTSLIPGPWSPAARQTVRKHGGLV